MLSSSSSEPSCFVCCGTDPPLRRACRCDMLAHPECLNKLVFTVPSHATRCALCRHPYSLRRTYGCGWTWTRGEVARICAAYVVLAVSTPLLFVAMASAEQSFVWVAVSACMSCVTVATFGSICYEHAMHRRERRSACCVGRRVKKVEVVALRQDECVLRQTVSSAQSATTKEYTMTSPV